MSDYRDRHPDVPEVGRAVLLPGRVFGPSRPLLGAVADVLLARGWAVRQVRWQVPEGLAARKATTWVVDEARTAADGWAERPLLVGKSLGTRAASYAAKQRLDAVWLTPLLRDRKVVRAIRRNRARQLLVCGTADTLAWDADVARSLETELLALPDADHGLVVEGDDERTAAGLERLRAAVNAWLP
jgi:pimeloyl-ACP methyl ester carboxylesterase